MNFKLHGSNSTEQMDINRKVGRLGEKIAKDDYRKSGYHTLDTRPGSFFDFVAMRFLNNWKLDIVFVEVKVGNSQLSKRQTMFSRWCRKSGQQFDVYRITMKHLNYLIENKIGGVDLA